MVRQPVVAGSFYPDDPDELRSMIEALTPEGKPKEQARAVLCPHAGYVFSGRVAAQTFAEVVMPQTVLLLNPSHSYSVPAFALWTGGNWRTPLGEVALHEGLTEALLELPLTVADNRPHVPEHSGEVVLPFLQFHNPLVRIAVICVTASAGLAELKELGRSLADVLVACAEQRALIVASSDMSHESSGGALDVVNRNDLLAIAQMEAMDPDGLHQVCRRERVTMCGVLPATAAMAAAAALGAGGGRLVARATSADSPAGGGPYVVGYAGMVFR